MLLTPLSVSVAIHVTSRHIIHTNFNDIWRNPTDIKKIELYKTVVFS